MDNEIKRIQKEQAEWSEHNFPNNTYVEPFMGMVEELGELSHSLLKQRQKIRGTYEEHELNAKDAVGDIMIYLFDLCNRRGWDLETIVKETWDNVVKKRDWKKNNTDGNV